MRISDWSSDVCSSDLELKFLTRGAECGRAGRSLERRDNCEIIGVAAQGSTGAKTCAGRILQCRLRVSGRQAQDKCDEACACQDLDQIGRASCRERGCQYV